MQVSAQGFVNIARRFLQYNALLRDAHRGPFADFEFSPDQSCPRRAEADAQDGPEQIAVTAAIAPETVRSSSQGFLSIFGLAYEVKHHPGRLSSRPPATSSRSLR
jgi:hypothetical protein